MVRSEEVTIALADLDRSTTELGTTVVGELSTRVQALIDQINKTAGEGLTGPQTEAVLASLASLKAGHETVRTALVGMGHNPQEPLPETPVLPPVPPPVV